MVNKQEDAFMSRIIPEISTTEKLTEQEIRVWCEMVRRYIAFHNGEDWTKIHLWGLFLRSDIKPQLENGQLVPYGKYAPRCLGWYSPSPEAYDKYIKPLLESDKIDKIGNLSLAYNMR
jgi:hypothetical protein